MGRDTAKGADEASSASEPAPQPSLITPREDEANQVYAVELPIFEGPLDLLLHLVRRHELDILDIPIAFVTEKYLEYLEVMRALDIEIAGDYLVMAATLAYLKSRELVPQQETEEEEAGEDDEDGEDPREALIRRLIEYERFRAAGRELNEMPVAGRDVFTRGGSIDLPPLDPGMAPVTLFRLAEAYARVLQRAKISKSHEVVIERVTVRQRMEQLSLILEERGDVEFDSLFLEREWGSVLELRQMLVVTLMSVLELVKLGIIGVRQPTDAATIRLLRRASHAAAMQALTGYDEDASFGDTPAKPPAPGAATSPAASATPAEVAELADDEEASEAATPLDAADDDDFAQASAGAGDVDEAGMDDRSADAGDVDDAHVAEAATSAADDDVAEEHAGAGDVDDADLDGRRGDDAGVDEASLAESEAGGVDDVFAEDDDADDGADEAVRGASVEARATFDADAEGDAWSLDDDEGDIADRDDVDFAAEDAGVAAPAKFDADRDGDAGDDEADVAGSDDADVAEEVRGTPEVRIYGVGDGDAESDDDALAEEDADVEVRVASDADTDGDTPSSRDDEAHFAKGGDASLAESEAGGVDDADLAEEDADVVETSGLDADGEGDERSSRDDDADFAEEEAGVEVRATPEANEGLGDAWSDAAVGDDVELAAEDGRGDVGDAKFDADIGDSGEDVAAAPGFGFESELADTHDQGFAGEDVREGALRRLDTQARVEAAVRLDEGEDVRPAGAEPEADALQESAPEGAAEAAYEGAQAPDGDETTGAAGPSEVDGGGDPRESDE